MKLIVLSVGKLPPGSLSRWSRDPDCVVITTRPVPEGCEDWIRPPISMTPKVSLSARQTQLFEPWFDSKLQSSDFRLPGAEIGFIEAANCQLFFQVWNCLGLLLDLEQVVQKQRIDRIEFVTDGTQHGRWPLVIRGLAEAHRLRWRTVDISMAGESLALRSLKRLRNWMAQSPTPMPSLIRFVRDQFVRRDRVAGDRSPETSPRTTESPPHYDSPSKRLHAAMLVYVPKSWRYLLPIRRALLEAGHEVSMFSPRNATDVALQAENCPYFALRLRFDGMRYRRKLKECLMDFPLNPPDAELTRMAHAGGPLRQVLWELSRGFFEDYANVAVRLPDFFRERNIDVVLGTDSGSVAGRSFFRTAERLGIASVFVQHGAVHGGMGTPEYFTDAKRLLWGDSSRDRLLKAGLRNPEATVVIGSPSHEQLLMPRRMAAPRSGAPPVRDPADMILVTFGVPGNFIADASFARAAGEVFAAAAELPNVRFVIRPHPSDRGSLWKELMSEWRLSNIVFARDTDTYELMRGCRILVTMASTTGAEAIFFGKPVVAVNLERQETDLDYIGAGAAYLASAPGELSAMIKSVLSKPEGADPLAEARRAFAEQFLHVEPRPAAERIVEYLCELVFPIQAAASRQNES
jgi:hypothetical protein